MISSGLRIRYLSFVRDNDNSFGHVILKAWLFSVRVDNNKIGAAY